MTDRFTIEIVPSPVYEIELIGRGPQGIQGPKGDTGATGPAGPAGPQGPKGDKGDPALTFTVGETIELPTSNSAYVENVGTDQDIVLDFGIPRGLTGASGKGVDIGTIIQSLSNVAPEGFVHTWGESISQEENPELYQACIDGTLPTVNASNGGVSTIYAPNGIFKQTPGSNTLDINSDVVMELAKIGGVVDWNGSYNPQPTGNITLASLSQDTETQILMFTEGGQNEVHFRFLEGSYSGKLAEAPSNPSNNTLYFNTVDKTYYIYEGGNWNQYGASGVGYIYLGGIIVTSNPATATWDDVGFIPADTTTTGLSEYDQQLVANKGNCGYFGLDTTELSVRVPTMQNVFLEENDTEVGAYKEAGLPNITGSTILAADHTDASYSGAFVPSTVHNANAFDRDSSGGWGEQRTVVFDASRSSATYGNSDTVQPEAIAVYFYVCVSKYTSLEQGPYFTPHVNENGILSWTNNGGLVNPPNTDIKGPKGDDAFTLSIGEVTTLNPDQQATVTNVGTATDQVWDIAIPAGKDGGSENDMLPLFHNFYSQEDMTSTGGYVNASLGSWLSGSVYEAAYNKLVEEVGTGNVKAVTDEYTDFDFVVNQDDMTFRLPLLNGDEFLPSDNYTVEENFTLDTPLVFKDVFTAPANGWYMVRELQSATGTLELHVNGYPVDLFGIGDSTQVVPYLKVFCKKGDVVSAGYNAGTYQILQVFFVYAKGNGNLYYKVANAVTNLELLNAGEILNALNLKADTNLSNINNDGTSLASSWAMPSNRYIDLTLGASGSTYTAPANGYFSVSGIKSGVGQVLFARADLDFIQNSRYVQDRAGFCLMSPPARKNDVYMVAHDGSITNGKLRFIYTEGEV